MPALHHRISEKTLKSINSALKSLQIIKPYRANFVFTEATYEDIVSHSVYFPLRRRPGT